MGVSYKILKERTLVIISVLLIAQYASLSQLSYTTARKTDPVLLGSGIATLLASSLFEEPLLPLSIAELENLSRSSVNRIDRSATYHYSQTDARWSDLLVGFSVASPAGLFFIKDVRLKAGTFSLMYLETILLSTFIPQICKRSVERYRPYSYNPDAPISERTNPDVRRSFFSGHTTSAFASAVFLSTVYSKIHNSGEWKSLVWTGSLLSATLVSYLRYSSGAHFPTDIVTGAIVGTAIGFIVPALHETSR
jgi:membrane-associated phospholipid phosphatase